MVVRWPWENWDFTAAQWNEFWSLGDVNQDGFIDGHGLDLIQQSIDSPVYEANTDLNGDGFNTTDDLMLCSENYGLTIWEHFGVPRYKIEVILGLTFIAGGIVIIAFAGMKGRQ